MYITTETEIGHHGFGSDPASVKVATVTRAARPAGQNVLEVWPVSGGRTPKRGDILATFRDGSTLYAMQSKREVRNA